MKISTAIALGSHLIRPLAGVHLNTTKTAGCAWGMAAIAAPEMYSEFFNRSNSTRTALPCECRHDKMATGGGMLSVPVTTLNNLSNVIVHLFNHHVCTVKDWTLEQLIDWVAANEPSDPEELVTERYHGKRKKKELVRA